MSAHGFIYTRYTLAPCAYCLAALGATRTDLYRVRPNGEKKDTGVSPFSQLYTPRSILLRHLAQLLENGNTNTLNASRFASLMHQVFEQSLYSLYVL